MFTVVEKLSKNKNIQDTIIVSVGTFIASVFSYLLQLFLGRSLSVADYGSFNALLSISYLIGVPASVLSVSLVKSVSEINAKNDTSKLSSLFADLVKKSLLLGLVVFLIISLLSGFISNELKIFDTWAVIIFGVLMGLSFFSVISSSFLQGLQRFTPFSFYTVASGFLRFSVSAVFVVLGFKLYGIFTGMSLAILMCFLIGLYFLKDVVKNAKNENLSNIYKKIFTFSFPVLIVNFGLMFLNNIDIILAKKYFSPETAGLYTGTVTLGKIILFGAGMVSTVMFPRIVNLYTRGEPYMKRFWEFFTLQFLIVLGCVTFYILFPRFITSLFFGERFLDSVQFLPLFAVFIGLYVLINFLTMFLLSIEKLGVAFILVICGFFQFILINMFHQSIFDIIHVDIFICIMVLVMIFGYIFFDVKKGGNK